MKLSGRLIQECSYRPINGKSWETVGDLIYALSDGRVIIVRSGFVTDFASSRLGRWNFLDARSTFSPAAVVHDYLYGGGSICKGGIVIQVTRKEADILFAIMLLQEGSSFRMTTRAYLGVRVGGGLWWKSR